MTELATPNEPFRLGLTPPVVEEMEIKLSDIVTDQGTQPRVSLNGETVDEYAEIVTQAIENQEPIPFPPVTVFRTSTGQMILADGFHRYTGHLKGGAEEILCEIRNGELIDAIIFSLGANVSHGVRRTTKDKQRSVKLAVHDERLSTLSDSEIARMCGVSAAMVGSHRPASNAPTERTVTIRGKTTTMDTSNIGKKRGRPKKEETSKNPEGSQEPETAPEAPNETSKPAPQTDGEVDKILGKIADAAGEEGGKFRRAVRDGSFQISMKDLRDFEGISASKIKQILPLVVHAGMKPQKAFDFVCSEVSDKTVDELYRRAMASPGNEFTFQNEFISVTAKILK